MRSLNKLILVATLLLVPACTFQDGLPWGKATFDVEAAFSDEGRESDGRLKTAKDYEIELDSLKINLVSVALKASADSVNSSFDPADPPEGYGLCHNGHCHAADGSLVDYETISAELAGASATGESVTQAIDEVVDFVQDPTVSFGECLNDCEMGRGFIQTVDLSVGSIEIQGRVFDSRSDSRLPAEGIELRGVVPFDDVFSAAVTGEVGRSEPPGIDVATSLTVTAPVFDVLDFAALQVDGVVDLSEQTQIHAEFNEKLKNTAVFNVNISRNDL